MLFEIEGDPITDLNHNQPNKFSISITICEYKITRLSRLYKDPMTTFLINIEWKPKHHKTLNNKTLSTGL